MSHPVSLCNTGYEDQGHEATMNLNLEPTRNVVNPMFMCIVAGFWIGEVVGLLWGLSVSTWRANRVVQDRIHVPTDHNCEHSCQLDGHPCQARISIL